MEMDSINLCFLCLSKCSNTISLVNTKICEQQLKEVIRQHFWFEFSDDSKIESDIVCTICFDKIQGFHEYYTNIRDIHFNVKNEKETALDDLEVLIKTESDTVNDDLPEVKINLSEKVDDKPIDIKPSVESDDSESDNDDNSEKDDDYDNSNNTDETDDEKITVKEKLRKRSPRNNRKKSSPNDKCENYKIMFEKLRDKLTLYFTFRCDLCSVALNSLIEARSHYRTVHNRKGYLVCCDRRFLEYTRIFEHLEWHSNPEAFKCSLCAKTFIDGTCLKKHIKDTHKANDGGPFKCPDCDKMFGRKNSFNLHVRSIHPKDGKRFKCSECDRMFALESLYRNHFKRVHQNSHMCDICAKIFKCPKSYELHYQVVHTKETEKVQCDLCGAWLKHASALKEHIRRQHNRKNTAPLMCEFCNKMYEHRDALTRHHRSMHSTVSFTCHVCGKIFKRAKNLKEHVAIHMGIKDLYTCSFCPKTFRSYANMCTHRKRDHPAEWQETKLMGNRFA